MSELTTNETGGGMSEPASNGRTWTPVLLIFALVAGVGALVSPMGLSIISNSADIDKVEQDLSEDIDKTDLGVSANRDSIANIRSELASMREQFAKVEVQHEGLKSGAAGIDNKIEQRLNILDKMIQQEIAAQAVSSEIVRTNQKDNIAAVQDLKVRTAQIETYLKTKALDGKAMP